MEILEIYKCGVIMYSNIWLMVFIELFMKIQNFGGDTDEEELACRIADDQHDGYLRHRLCGGSSAQ